VGFHVYKLRRVITSSFDCYFHLWNNGTPHWEREKRAWEIEQEKEWTRVLSKSSKKEAAKSQKRVTFDKNLVYTSPPKKSPRVQSPPLMEIFFGAFSTLIDPTSTSPQFGNTDAETRSHHDCVLRIPDMQRPNMQHHREMAADDMQRPNMQRHREIAAADTTLNQRVLMDQISNSKSTVNGPLCSRCLNLGHTRSKCPGRVRCWKCLNFGHTRNFCLSRGQLS
jgi:hypothetical protein